MTTAHTKSAASTNLRPSGRWSCPSSKLVLRADAPQDKWLQARKLGIGGSDVSAILGFSKWASGYGTWLTKTGRDTPQDYNAAMRWGHLLEPALRQAFMEDTGIRVRSAGLHRSKEHAFMQVSLDGLTEDGGIFESKTTSGWLREEWEDDQIPDHAELQVQHGMAVTGRSHAWVVGLIDGRDFIVRRVERDEVMIRNLIDLEQQWWETYVLGDVAPPVTAVSLKEVMGRWPDETTDGEGAEIDKPAALVTAIKDRIDAAKDLMKKYEAEAHQAEAELRDLAGPAVSLTADGEPFATFKSTGTFASSKFKEKYPELAEQYTVPKPALDMDRFKEEQPDIYQQFRSRVLRFPKPKK